MKVFGSIRDRYQQGRTPDRPTQESPAGHAGASPRYRDSDGAHLGSMRSTTGTPASAKGSVVAPLAVELALIEVGDLR